MARRPEYVIDPWDGTIYRIADNGVPVKVGRIDVPQVPSEIWHEIYKRLSRGFKILRTK